MELGSDPKKLEQHCDVIVQLALSTIERGVLSGHLNWQEVQERSSKLLIVKVSVFHKKKPGWEHWPFPDYYKEYGGVNAYGFLGQGRRLYTLAGAPCVRVAASGVAKLQVGEKIQPRLENEALYVLS